MRLRTARRQLRRCVKTQLPSDYVTSFPLSEGILSEGGIWTNGLQNGQDWQNNATDGSGLAYGTGASPPGSFNDNVSTLQGYWSPVKHYAWWKYHLFSGYTPTDSHECELLLGATVSAHSWVGYEVDFGFGTSFSIVRENGAVGDFSLTAMTLVSGAAFSVADGDIVLGLFDSTSGTPTIKVWKNPVGASVQAWLATGASAIYHDVTAGNILQGNPGFGTFARPQAGLDMKKLCINQFGAGNG